MKKRVTMVSVIALAAALLTMVGYLIVTIIPSLPRPLKDAENHYTKAATTAQNAQNLQLQVSMTTNILVDDQTYTESSQQTLTLQGLHTDSMVASLSETLTVGTHETSVAETYADDMVYITMQGSHFSGDCTAEEFLDRCVPSILLDPVLYKNIQGKIKNHTLIITFSQATAGESWALPEGSIFISSEGTAWLTEDDTLTRSQYTVTYRYADATVTTFYDVKVDASVNVSIAAPANVGDYTFLEAPYAPRMLEKATGYLTQSGSISAEYSEYILCQAFGDERTREISINMDTANGWSARLDTAVTLANSSRQDDIVHLTQAEVFKDGAHIVSIDGAAPEADATITKDALRSYCHELLLGTIMLPQYIEGASCTEQSDAYRITFTANEAFARSVCAYTCQTLYQDATVLDSMAENYEINQILCYLDISRSTGLPTAAGVDFKGSYTIHGLEYQLIYQADQNYSMPSDSAADLINKPLS